MCVCILTVQGDLHELAEQNPRQAYELSGRASWVGEFQGQDLIYTKVSSTGGKR